MNTTFVLQKRNDLFCLTVILLMCKQSCGNLFPEKNDCLPKYAVHCILCLWLNFDTHINFGLTLGVTDVEYCSKINTQHIFIAICIKMPYNIIVFSSAGLNLRQSRQTA